MKIQNLIGKVLYKAAPMGAAEFDDLNKDMNVWFDRQSIAVKTKIQEAKEAGNEPKLNLKDKAFQMLDEWYIRALCAVLYIFIIRWVMDFMNPGDPEDEHEHPDLLDRR